MEYDVFVSYAHSDDEVPVGARNGWVTTFVQELRKVLRRKMGGDGPRIWMDYSLAANENVPATLREKVRASRTLVLFMSRGYLRSGWCKGELDDFLRVNGADRNRERVFVVAMDETDRQSWPPRVNELTPLTLFRRTNALRLDSYADETELLGFPNPPAESDTDYWRRLNELAHLVFKQLEPPVLPPSARDTTVWIAQPTDALQGEWDALAAAIRQRGFNVRPGGPSMYPTHDAAAFRNAVEGDIRASRWLVQLLDAAPGPKVGRSGDTIDAFQFALAKLEAKTREDATFLRWRGRAVNLDAVEDPEHQQLLRGAIASGIEQFRQQVLDLIDPPPPDPSDADMLPFGEAGRDMLTLGVTGGPRDVDLSGKVARIVQDIGELPVVIPPAPGDNQSQTSYRESLDALLTSADGIVLVHGEENDFWIRSRHSQFRKVIAQTVRGVWGAHVGAPPPKQSSVRIPDPAVLYYDCSGGAIRESIEEFVKVLKQKREKNA